MAIFAMFCQSFMLVLVVMSFYLLLCYSTIVVFFQVSFSTEIFGTFRQSLVFDFGLEPLLMKELCVDSCPVTDLDQLTEDLILNQSGRWDINNISVIEFSPKSVKHLLHSLHAWAQFICRVHFEE